MEESREYIRVGGFPLSHLLQGASYRVNRLSGWWQRPSVKRTTVARSRADGDLPMPWDFNARHIAIDGHITARDHNHMHHVMDTLSAIATTDREWLSIQGHGPLTAALVEADDEPFLMPVTDRKFRFELRFKANDPRRYGERWDRPLIGGTNEYRQYGTYPSPVHAYPRLSAVAAGNGYTLTAAVPRVGNRVWECFGVIGMSSIEHHADITAGVHFVEGQRVDEHMGRMQSWMLPGQGRLTTITTAVLDGGTFNSGGTLRYWDTYI